MFLLNQLYLFRYKLDRLKPKIQKVCEYSIKNLVLTFLVLKNGSSFFALNDKEMKTVKGGKIFLHMLILSSI